MMSYKVWCKMPELILKYNPKILEQAAPIEMPPLDKLLYANFEKELVDIVLAVKAQILNTISNKDFNEDMHKHSPGLKGFNWKLYLLASSVRVLRMLNLLENLVPQGSHVLDFGSYFGNFSLAAKWAGYKVTAVDFYNQYGNNFTELVYILRQNDITVLDAETFAYDIKVNAILMMGVIEHIPHTPRIVLNNIKKLVARQGVLILETPNLAYIYKRRRLMEGYSPYPNIQDQYFTEIPFAGHHREYTIDEIEWMLSIEGFKILKKHMYNYSYLSNTHITDDVKDVLIAGQNDLQQRELILVGAYYDGNSVG